MLLLQPADQRADAWRPLVLADDLRDRQRDLTGIEIEDGADERLAVAAELAEHARALLGVHVEQDRLDLALDQVALLFDHEHFGEAIGETLNLRWLDRPRHADLEDAQAQRRGLAVADAK